MSLATPSKIRELQIKLYRKAKSEPGYRFYMLYDKIWREDILAHAYALARANKGAPGVDGQTFEQIESAGLEEWLTGIRQELRNKTYQPQPVRRVMIPKPGERKSPRSAGWALPVAPSVPLAVTLELDLTGVESFQIYAAGFRHSPRSLKDPRAHRRGRHGRGVQRARYAPGSPGCD